MPPEPTSDFSCKKSTKSALLCLTFAQVAWLQNPIFLAGFTLAALFSGLGFGAPSTSRFFLNFLGTVSNFFLMESFLGLQKMLDKDSSLEWAAGSLCTQSLVTKMACCFTAEKIKNNIWNIFSAGFSLNAMHFCFAWFVPVMPKVLNTLIGTSSALCYMTAFLAARKKYEPAGAAQPLLG